MCFRPFIVNCSFMVVWVSYINAELGDYLIFFPRLLENYQIMWMLNVADDHEQTINYEWPYASLMSFPVQENTITVTKERKLQ